MDSTPPEGQPAARGPKQADQGDKRPQPDQRDEPTAQSPSRPVEAEQGSSIWAATDRATTQSPAHAPSPGTVLARSLAGELPCVVCRYDLQGVSVRGVCPECGTLVRASILAIVDPLARELTPIKYPKIVSTGIVLWAGCSMLACVLGLITSLDLIASNWSVHTPMADATIARAWLIAGFLGLAGLGVLMFARPHARVPITTSAMAALAGLSYAPLAACVIGTARAAALTPGGTELQVLWPADNRRTWWSLSGWCVALAIIALVRPIARLMVTRNQAMRTGRVDRQTLVATAAAIAVLILGDALGMFSTRHAQAGDGQSVLSLLAVAMVALGAVLLVMGLAGSCVDGFRIARAVLKPGPSLRSVVEPTNTPPDPPEGNASGGNDASGGAGIRGGRQGDAHSSLPGTGSNGP